MRLVRWHPLARPAGVAQTPLWVRRAEPAGAGAKAVGRVRAGSVHAGAMPKEMLRQSLSRCKPLRGAAKAPAQGLICQLADCAGAVPFVAAGSGFLETLRNLATLPRA